MNRNAHTKCKKGRSIQLYFHPLYSQFPNDPYNNTLFHLLILFSTVTHPKGITCARHKNNTVSKRQSTKIIHDDKTTFSFIHHWNPNHLYLLLIISSFTYVYILLITGGLSTLFSLYQDSSYTLFAAYIPSTIPAKQNNTLHTVYAALKKYCFSWNSWYASKEKVENVVNPPHTPVFKNRRRYWGISLRTAVPAIKPIANAPSTFVASVSTGKGDLHGRRLIAYLNIAPVAPPSPTNIKPINTTFSFSILLPDRSYTYLPDPVFSHSRSCAVCQNCICPPVFLSVPPSVQCLTHV